MTRLHRTGRRASREAATGLVLVLALIAASCGGNDDGGAPATGTTEAPSEPAPPNHIVCREST